ncbi:hypothetical protein HDV02_005126, partial [Globomyces sp. JEL0801]
IIGLILGLIVEFSLSQYFNEPLISMVGTWALTAIAVKSFPKSTLIGIISIIIASLLFLQTIQLIVVGKWFKYRTLESGRNSVVQVE